MNPKVLTAQMMAYVVDSAITTICLSLLAVYFNTWWIVLFAIVLTPSVKSFVSNCITNNAKKDDRQADN